MKQWSLSAKVELLKAEIFYLTINNNNNNNNNNNTSTIKARDVRRITAAEMKKMRRKSGYTWTNYKTNTQTAKELKITPILDKLLEYKRNWIQRVNRMSRNIFPRVMRPYSPTGRRNHGRL
jgi:hypothetical protein